MIRDGKRIGLIVVLCLLGLVGCSGEKPIDSNVIKGISTANPENTNAVDNQVLLLGLDKQRVIELCGKDYTIFTGEGVEGFNKKIDGIFYQKLNITLVFDENQLTKEIFGAGCRVKGINTKMTFDEIFEVLGETKINKTWVETPDHKLYQISYRLDDAKLVISSYQKNGKVSIIHAYRIL